MKIIKFKASWKPNENQGQIAILLENSDQKVLLLDQPAEFSTILLILQGDDDCYYTKGGIITTGIDDVGF